MCDVTAREQRNAMPRIVTPAVVVKTGSPEIQPRKVAYAVRIALTIAKVIDPAIRRVIQPMAGMGAVEDGIRILPRKSRREIFPPRWRSLSAGRHHGRVMSFLWPGPLALRLGGSPFRSLIYEPTRVQGPYPV